MDTSAEQTANKGYFVTDTAGQTIAVCFEPLTADDINALNGDDWRGARFGAVWKEWAEHNLALKLVRCDGSDASILGIVSFGTVERRHGRPDLLRDNLLETCPMYQYRMTDRRYRGIGRVLVARLAEESKARRAKGRVLVRPAQGSIEFYAALGFVLYKDNRYYLLETNSAAKLLRLYGMSSLD